MPANHSSPRIHYLAGVFRNSEHRLGWLIGPSARKKTRLRPWLPYALDNDAFSAWSKKAIWDYEAWRALLEWAAASAFKPRWLLVPDKVADRDGTLDNWKKYAPEAAAFGWPLAFAAQDGMTPDDVPSNASVVFIGGSTDWKWRNLPAFAERFQRVHVGRVNELRRLITCAKYRVESCDGTGWFRDQSDPRKLDRLEAWMAGELTDDHPELDFEAQPATECFDD